MKKYILYLTTITLGLLLGGCSLKEDPKFAYRPDPTFNSKETTLATVLDGYASLASLYSERILIPTVANGTMVSRVNGQEVALAASYSVDPRGGNLYSSYLDLYGMVNNSNTIIEGMKKSTLPEDYKEEVLGHAYFIRGYAYYLLASLWGRSPVYLTPVVKNQASINKPLSPRKDVYAQAEADLLVASEKLPNETAIGFANKNVANAYLAKLYFMLASQKQAGLETSNYTSAEELWDKTIEYGNKVDNKTYLDPDYANLFGSGVSNSPEIIFQLNYTSYLERGIRKSWNHLFGPYYYSYFSGKMPSPDSYRMVTMDRAFYDYHAGSHPGDKRMSTIYLTNFLEKKPNDKGKLPRVVAYPFVLDTEASTETNTVILDGRKYRKADSDPKNPEYDFNDNSNPEWNIVKKVWNSDKDNVGRLNLFPYSGKGSDEYSVDYYDTNNVILFRNADLLLILADAYNELGNESESNKYINLVLTRAGLGNAPSMSKEERREYIFFERMFELAGESVLFEDIRRRGTEYLKKVIKIHNDSHFIDHRYKLLEGSGIEYRAIIINDKNLDDNFLKTNLLLPIPQQEINQNENISQSDQNFGYN